MTTGVAKAQSKAYLWTPEQLGMWAKSPHKEARLWAVGHLKHWYPEAAAPLMAALLQDPDGDVAAKAAWFFANQPDPRVADALLLGFQSDRPELTGPCAWALSKLGDRRFVEHFEKHFTGDPPDSRDHYQLYCSLAEQKSALGLRAMRLLLEELSEAVAKGEEGVRLPFADIAFQLGDALLYSRLPEETRWLVRYCVTSRDEDLQSAIFNALLKHVRAPYSQAELEEERKGMPLFRLSPTELEQLKFLKTQGAWRSGKEVEREFRQQRWAGVIQRLQQEAQEIVEDARAQAGEAAMEEWQAKPSNPQAALQILRAIAGEEAVAAQAALRVHRKLAVVALLIFNRLLDAREFIGSSPEAMNTESRLNLLLGDRAFLDKEDETLIRLLAEEEKREPIVAACLKKIRKAPDSQGGLRAIQLLGTMRCSEAAAPLLSVLTHTDLLFVEETVVEALSEIGEPVLPLLEAVLNRGKERDLYQVLPLLGLLPYPRTCELITSHYAQFYELDKISLVETVEKLGAASFLPLLKQAMREGEPDEEVYLTLGRLHDLSDPALSEIERRAARRLEESEERLKRLRAGDRRALLNEPLPLSLRCLKCRCTYTYKIREILADPNVKKFGNAIHILDAIVCKGCGARDSYELTAEALMAVTASLKSVMDLAEDGLADPNEGTVKVGTLMADGRTMNPGDARQYYQRKITNEPRRAELRVAYGNVLKFEHRDEEAKAQFEKAVELEPLAVEALSSLAGYERETGNPEKALGLYRRCLEVFSKAPFYRLQEDRRDAFQEQIEMRVWELEEELELHQIPEAKSPALAPLLMAGVKAGRNDPCPCGSGRKYKKCCLGKEEPKRSADLPQSMMTTEEVALKGRLLSFAFQRKFEREVSRALEIFFRDSAKVLSKPSLDDPEMLEFFEWLFYDHAFFDGATLAEKFLRSDGRLLPANEKSILQNLMNSSLGLYEVQQVSQENAEIRVKDLVTGKESTAKDVAGSRQLVKWDLIGSRLVPIQGQMRLSPCILVFQPRERDDLLSYLNQEWDQYQKEHGTCSWVAFMKPRGYLLHHYIEKRGTHKPQFVTPEHHEMVFCKGIYSVNNYHGVLFRLRNESDFVEEEPPQDEQGELRFTWIKRGKSREAVLQGPPTRNGLVMQSSLLPTPISEGVLTLGSVAVTEDQLILEAFSKERLAAGKRRLEEVLKSYAGFKVDAFQSVEEALKAHPESEKEDKTLPEQLSLPGYEAAAASMLERYYKQWLTSPIPALQGETPMKAKDSPDGRQRLEIVLKDIENAQLRKHGGALQLDVSALRQRLGLN